MNQYHNPKPRPDIKLVITLLFTEFLFVIKSQVKVLENIID